LPPGPGAAVIAHPPQYLGERRLS